MQSSGIGNCLNLFSLTENCRMPLVILVTMRGEFAEFVPWQIPMGKRTPAALELMQFDVFRVEEAAVTGDIVSGAIDHAFFSKRSVAPRLKRAVEPRQSLALKLFQNIDCRFFPANFLDGGPIGGNLPHHKKTEHLRSEMGEIKCG